MRKIPVTLVCTILLLAAKAQFSFGPKAGLNLAKMSFSSSNYKTSFKPFFYGGLFANYQVNTQWAAQLEVLYSGEGTKEKLVSGGTTGHINEGYVQIPLLLQFHTSIGAFVEAGPQLGLMLSSKESYGTSSSTDIKKYYNTVEFRVPFGIGYEFPSSSPVKGLGVNARYSFNFSKINKVAVGGESLKNKVISIGAYYKIPAFNKHK